MKEHVFIILTTPCSTQNFPSQGSNPCPCTESSASQPLDHQRSPIPRLKKKKMKEESSLAQNWTLEQEKDFGGTLMKSVQSVSFS